MPQIATERLYMRPYRVSEHHLMHALIADPRVTFWRKPPMPAAETRAIFNAKLALVERGLGWWAVFLNDQLGAHGAPIKVKVGQQEIFLCCKGCNGNHSQDVTAKIEKKLRLT